MNRQEHLDWCKKRAIEYIDNGDLTGAFAPFQSDMSKHPELEDHRALSMLSMMMISGQIQTASEMKKFIESFN